MANLEVVRFCPKRCSVADGKVEWFAVNGAAAIEGMPQIFWSNRSPWREANRDSLASLLVKADAKILELTLENARLRAQVPSSKVTPIHQGSSAAA